MHSSMKNMQTVARGISALYLYHNYAKAKGLEW